MLGLSLKAATSNFFDRAVVKNAMDKGSIRALKRSGAYVRKVMRNSMKKRKGAAPAGTPPHVHAGDLKRLTLYAFDPAAKSVVIGPVKFSKGTAPEVLERGGKVIDYGFFSSAGKWVPLRLIKTIGRQALLRSGRVIAREFRVEARPYSRPALDASAPALPEFWRDSFKKGG